jgi:hypothetical protein
MPVVTGWNFTEYDWVFLVNRARKNRSLILVQLQNTRLLRTPFKRDNKSGKEMWRFKTSSSIRGRVPPASEWFEFEVEVKEDVHHHLINEKWEIRNGK